MRTAALLAFGFVVIACKGAADPATTSAPPRTAGHCGASSVVTTTSCPKRTIPPSNKSSARGCKSDADCKDGIDGRCVDSGYRGAAAPARGNGNLLAEPPAAPPPTICVYDQCTANADCGTKARCACGDDTARAACVPLDACLADADCGEAMLCTCGGSGQPNTCVAGNCRADADCSAGQKCHGGPSGNFCTTPNDACHERVDCDAPNAYRVCDYDRTKKSWSCRDVPPLPAG